MFLVLVALQKAQALVIGVLCVLIPLATLQLWIHPAHMFLVATVNFLWDALSMVAKVFVKFVNFGL